MWIHLLPLELIDGAGDGTPTVTVDTHDDAEHFRRRDEEIRRRKLELREQLLQAVERVTGKPPSLDASERTLASIARKSESFDYGAALREIEEIEEAVRADAQRARDRLAEKARRQQRADEEEAILMILLGPR